MNSDGFVFLVLLAGSIAFALDYGTAGKSMLDASQSERAAGPDNHFVRGLGWLLLTPVGVNMFWVGALIANSIITVPGPILAAIYAAMVVAAILGRRRWFRRILPAVNGHSKQEFPDDAP